MARPQTPPIFAQMRHARSYTEQVAALRALKNDVTGHVQRKEQWVEAGILDHIVKLLQNARTQQGQNGKVPGSEAWPYALSDQELVRLQALQLLSIFAKGGPSFIKPIQEAGAIPAILANTFPVDNPGLVVVAALRTLHSITAASNLSTQASTSLSVLADSILVPPTLGAFHSILGSGIHTYSFETKLLVASLIGRLCREDKHRNALANYGILDDLATLLAGFVVARGEVVPGAAEQGINDGLNELIPNPAPPGTKLDVILEAIAAIIAESRFRAYLFINSPALLAIFPYVDFNPLAKAPRTTRDTLETAGLASTRWRLGAMDYILPIVPSSQPKASTMSFPSLGSSLSRHNSGATGNGNSRSLSRFTFGETAQPEKPSSPPSDLDLEDVESPLVPWLIHLFRSTSGLERVMAASLLACLFKADFVDSERESMIACLVVPPLFDLIKETSEDVLGSGTAASHNPESWRLLLEALDVVARLVAGAELRTELLRKAAVDSGAIRRASTLLTESYSMISEPAPPRPWSPTTDKVLGADGYAPRLGEPGLLPSRAYRLRLRESSLRLIASIIPYKEEYRKLFDETGAVGYVVESLKSCPSKPSMAKEEAEDKGAEEPDPSHGESPYGNNSNSTIISACNVIRLLSRSIKVLRTSLSDYGVGRPLFRLLRQPDIKVQVAACSAVSNLVVEFSPVREALLNLGVIKVLCEHAHSQEAELRHGAMWALKHVVVGGDNALKKQCIDELQPGWLVQLICADTEDDALFARRSRGKQLQAVDADDDEPMETESFPEDDESENVRKWVWPGLYATRDIGTAFQRRVQSPRILRAESKLLALREAELDPVRKARNDDLAIQEQALGFIRNLLHCSSETADDQTEMVDYLFSELGQDRFFEILTSRLTTRTLHPFQRKHSRSVPPQARNVGHVIFILTHIAASVPRHRQLVISQTELLKQVGQHFNSKNAEVRAAVCQLLINLVWKDDQNDQEACQLRKAELRRLGFESKLQGLEGNDASLGVREKARLAAWELKS